MKRRDFLNGLSLSIGASVALGPKTLLAQAITTSNETGTISHYPPLLTGMRGSHDGSYEVAHKLAWGGQKPEHYDSLAEDYDLVVVGAGISGLAAAFFYQQQHGRDKRILILDNHDDFGGHAKRNEFQVQNKTLMGFGGSINLEHINDISDECAQFFKDIDVNFNSLEKHLHPNYPFADFSKPIAIFFNGKTVTGTWIAAFHGKGDYQSLVNQLNLDQSEKDKLIQFFSGKRDFLNDLSIIEKWDYLNNNSYQDFLTDRIGLAPETQKLFEAIPRIGTGVGGDCLSAMEMFDSGAPGMKAVGWLGKTADELLFDKDDIYSAYYFPDGNASIARLLVRKLIPTVAPGNSMEDIVQAKFDYSKLDQAESSVRLRLNSTVVNVAHREDEQVKISYVTAADKPYQIRGKRCILACYNGIIPHLCPELPEQQKQNLKYGVKVPFIWANVALRKGSSFYKAGSNFYTCPDSFFELVTSAPPSDLNPANASTNPDDPMVVFLGHVPSPQRTGELTPRDLFRQARHKIYATPFASYEMEIRNQLTAMFGEHGFDPDTDIEAITVNRWSHGYAYSYMQLFDKDIADDEKPHILGRKPFGRITIANTDSEAHAYVDGAVDAAWRAVQEQTSL